MKRINTLVEDIYKLFTHPKEKLNATGLQDLGTRISAKVASSLTERKRPSFLRMSNLGDPCSRRLWYSINTPGRAERLSAHTRIKFLFGDILEELLLYLAEEAGHRVENKQSEVSLHGVKGHIDATIDGELVDSKSASTPSFAKFRDHTLGQDDAFGYITQLDLYLSSASNLPTLENKESAHFLAIDKQLGHIVLDTYKKTDTDWEKVIDEKRELLAKTEPPERPFEDQPEGKSGNRKLGITCSYCPFKHHCWSDANDGNGLRTFLYSSKPVFLTHVQREPKVQEYKGSEGF